MPHTYLCFVWHMHQPYYKTLSSGTYVLPWTRLHGLKDYLGMVKILGEFPGVRQTFNVVPSMMVQLEEYGAGAAHDPFLETALRPAEELSLDEQAFALRYFFQATPRLIQRLPRLRELQEQVLAAAGDVQAVRQRFRAGDWRDLQVLSQLAWFDEDVLANDAEVRALVRKGRGFTRDEQVMLGRAQRQILGQILPTYREFAQRGQIELSTTPFYHPILPLVCDSDIARVAMPQATLPRRFCYPQDAAWQLREAHGYVRERLGVTPAGLWPSEGSVSDEALTAAVDAGFHWAATDNGVLSRTLEREAGWTETYRPYQWRQGGREMSLLFRDHYLSDLIGFTYANWAAADAVRNFLERIREGARSVTATGRDAVVPVILDGENCWEFYDQNGRPFLRELYRQIERDRDMTATTVAEALRRVEPEPLSRIHPGSWIDADFHIWIGADEDNDAWELLLAAREAYEAALPTLEKQAQERAWQALMVAEGSDWFWWYGPEHQSDNRVEFDSLFRAQLAVVYDCLGQPAPEALGKTLLRSAPTAQWEPAFAAITPSLDGGVDPTLEWHGSGTYHADSRAGAMHGQRELVQAVRYGSDGVRSVFLRFDLDAGLQPRQGEWEIGIHVHDQRVRVRMQDGWLACDQPGCAAALNSVLEVSVPFGLVGLKHWDLLRFHVTVTQGGVESARLPREGRFEFYL